MKNRKTRFKTVNFCFIQNESSVKFPYFDQIFHIFPDNEQANYVVLGSSITGYLTDTKLYIDFCSEKEKLKITQAIERK